MKNTKRLLILIAFLINSLLSFSQWNYLGLVQAGTTTDLTLYSDTIYASTHDGIFKKHVLSTDTNWITCGMQGNHVVQTLIKDDQHFISVVEIGTSKTTRIYSTNDGGLTFNLMNTDTSLYNSYQFLNAIAHPPGNYDTLYFMNHQLKTYDGGITWDTIYTPLFNNRFITVNPTQHNELLMGGESWILSPMVQASPDNGTNWAIPNMNGYFAGDNCVHDLLIDNNNTWTAVGEGVICRTNDGGDNWIQLLNVWTWPQQWALYIWDIEVSPTDNNKIYATGASSSPAYIVPLVYSQNNGATWDTLSYSSYPLSPDIHCLAVIPNTSGDKIFLGGNGVYCYQNNFAGINESNHVNKLSLFPNPLTVSTTLHTENSCEDATLTIFNTLGEQVEQIKNISGKSFIIPRNNLPSGVYIIHLMQANKQISSGKLIIVN